MNMNTIKQELNKKIKRMDRRALDKFIDWLNLTYLKTHNGWYDDYTRIPEDQWNRN